MWKELAVARDFLPLAIADFRLKACSTVFCSEASSFVWAALRLLPLWQRATVGITVVVAFCVAAQPTPRPSMLCVGLCFVLVASSSMCGQIAHLDRLNRSRQEGCLSSRYRRGRPVEGSLKHRWRRQL